MVLITEPLNTKDVLQWAPSLPVEKGPHLNPLRWCVVVLLMEPLNTMDVLQWVRSLPIKKGPCLNT